MYGRGADQPGNERSVFHRVPCPVAAPAKFHVGPPSSDDDADGKKEPCREGEGPRDIKPGLFASVDMHGLRQSQAAGYDKASVTEEKQWRMKYHAGVLEQRIHAPPVRRGGRKLNEGIAPGGDQQREETHDGKVEHPVPQSGFRAEKPVGTGELKKGSAQRDHERPEQHGTGLSGPEGGDLVEHGQHQIRVAGHIFKRKVTHGQGMKQNGRSRGQAGGDNKIGLFQPAEVGMAALPELGRPHARTSHGAEQGEKKQNICGKIHAISEKSRLC